jgi:periplasmic divalent cation tolerance protein
VLPQRLDDEHGQRDDPATGLGLGERLVRNVTRHLSVRSVYRWQGVIEDEGEARVALHTRTNLVPAIVERANREHSYDVPCVIALPVVAGNPAYIDWVLSETAETAKSTETDEPVQQG